MSKGLEMMVNMIFKSIDLEPEKIIEQFRGAQELLVSSVKNFDERLVNIENSVVELTATLVKLTATIEGLKNGNQSEIG